MMQAPYPGYDRLASQKLYMVTRDGVHLGWVQAESRDVFKAGTEAWHYTGRPKAWTRVEYKGA